MFVWTAILFSLSSHQVLSLGRQRHCSPHMRLFVPSSGQGCPTCPLPPADTQQNTTLFYDDFYLCPIHGTTSVQEAASETSQLWQNPLVRKHCSGCKQFEKEGKAGVCCLFLYSNLIKSETWQKLGHKQIIKTLIINEFTA